MATRALCHRDNLRDLLGRRNVAGQLKRADRSLLVCKILDHPAQCAFNPDRSLRRMQYPVRGPEILQCPADEAVVGIRVQGYGVTLEDHFPGGVQMVGACVQARACAVGHLVGMAVCVIAGELRSRLDGEVCWVVYSVDDHVDQRRNFRPLQHDYLVGKLGLIGHGSDTAAAA